jgi:hypothetical protein
LSPPYLPSRPFTLMNPIVCPWASMAPLLSMCWILLGNIYSCSLYFGDPISALPPFGGPHFLCCPSSFSWHCCFLPLGLWDSLFLCLYLMDTTM